MQEISLHVIASEQGGDLLVPSASAQRLCHISTSLLLSSLASFSVFLFPEFEMFMKCHKQIRLAVCADSWKGSSSQNIQAGGRNVTCSILYQTSQRENSIYWPSKIARIRACQALAPHRPLLWQDFWVMMSMVCLKCCELHRQNFIWFLSWQISVLHTSLHFY